MEGEVVAPTFIQFPMEKKEGYTFIGSHSNGQQIIVIWTM